MDSLINHAAALELAARDILFPVCGFGVAWCIIGIEAVLALVVMATVIAYMHGAVRYGLSVRDRNQTFTWFDWAVLLLLWWLFELLNCLNRPPR